MRRFLLISMAIMTLCLCSGQRCDLTPIVDVLETGNSPFDDDFDFFSFLADEAAEDQ